MKSNSMLRALSLAAALCVVGVSASAEEVTNGSFSGGSTGWNSAAGLPIFGSDAVALPFVSLGGWSTPSVIYQSLDLDFSTSYKLTFDSIGAGTVDLYSEDFALCTGLGSGCTTDEVAVSGAGTHTFYFATTGGANWTHLSFSSGTSAGFLALDNVSVTAVPEPETYAMMLAGLGAIGYMARRRKAG